MDEESRDWRDYRAGPREMWRTYAWVWDVLLGAETKGRTPQLILESIAACAFSLVGPWLIGKIADLLANHSPWSSIQHLLILMFLALNAYIWFHHREAITRELILGSVLGEVDENLNRLFLAKSLGQHLRENESLSAAAIQTGRSRIWEAALTVLFEGISTVFFLVITLFCIFYASPSFGCAVVVLFIVQLLWSGKVNTTVMQEAVPLDGDMRELHNHRGERWEHVERVKTSGKEDEEQEVMSSWFRRLIKRDRTIWIPFIGVQTKRTGLNAYVVFGLTALGIWEIFSGRWSLGLVWPIIAWLNVLKDRIAQLGDIERKISWCHASIRSLKITLMTPSDIQDKPDAIELVRNGPIELEFRHVSFGYMEKGVEQGILRDINFKIKRGSRVALLGPSGGGKSTIMRLCQRGMDPQAGEVFINGIDIRDIQLHSWLSLVGYIPQKSVVFSGSFRSNLLYGMTPEDRLTMTDDHLWSLMRDLQVDFGSRLSEGLETVVGRCGVRLSGGEAQRLSIGSAVAKKPRFMLIDEATSNLDSTTEKAVQRGLAKALEGDVSALIIAHRLSTVADICDTFVVVRRLQDVPEGESQIEAIGHSFQELYQNSPTFRALADDQGIVI